MKEEYGIQLNVTNARVGDVVEWEFYSGARRIIRGYCDFLCVPYEYSGVGREGFSSGEQRVDRDQEDVRLCASSVQEALSEPTQKFFYRKRINKTFPILFYSGAPDT